MYYPAYMPADWFQADEGPIKAPVVPRGPVVDQEGWSRGAGLPWEDLVFP